MMMIAMEKTDHSFGPGRLFVVWAKGQQSGHYYHYPPSAIETNQISDHMFYKQDEIKYHGG
jgi:hypothetical protein